MPVTSLRASAATGARARSSRGIATRRIAEALDRFDRPSGVRARVCALAGGDAALAELAVTFPALLVALALPGDEKARDAAVALVVAGAPARAAARSVRLPLWMRRLPAEAFIGRIPEVPASERFACRIMNALPSPDSAACWLLLLAAAHAAGDEHFVLWAAREAKALTPRARAPDRIIDRSPIRTLALLAWFSRAPGTLAHALITRPWNPQMHAAAACGAAQEWLERMEAELCLGGSGPLDPWLEPGQVDGIAFHPITTAGQIADEASAMQHCVLSYAPAVAQGTCRVWSLRRDGHRVATMEVRASGAARRFPTIVQIQGPANSDVDEPVWRAAHVWLSRQPRLSCAVAVDAPAHDVLWRRLWMPYWRAYGLVDWLPTRPPANGVWQLASHL